jgi:hypothetical protein
MDRLISLLSKPPKNVIGLMSRGIWLRRKKGESSDEGEYEAEEQLLNDLKSYLSNNNVRLRIYLHPIEKRNEKLLEESKSYYSDFFEDNEKLYVCDGKKSSLEYFDEYEVGISAYSSTNIERLYCGFKTLYAPYKMKNTLFENSEISNICIKNSNDFSNVMTKTLNQSNNDFFQNNGLHNYTHKSFLQGKFISLD